MNRADGVGFAARSYHFVLQMGINVRYGTSMRKIRSKLSFVRQPFLWAGLLLAAAIGLQYLGAWYGRELNRISMETDLENHLADLGGLAESILGDNALTLADRALEASWTTGTADINLYRNALNESQTEPFDRFANLARLARIVVLNDRGQILFDTEQPDRLLIPFDFWAIDRSETSRALTGQSAASPAYQSGDSPYKRYYVPILEASDMEEQPAEVRALLCLVAGRIYLEQIHELSSRVRQVNLVLTLLMLLLGWLIFRLVQRQRRLAHQAADADRLVGLGRLAAGFAHELRNPLEIVRAFTEDLERSLSSGSQPDEAAESCREIVEEVDRMNRLVGQFLTYSRQERETLGEGDAPVLDGLDSVTAILEKKAAGHGIRIERNAAGELEKAARQWTVGLPPDAFKQILLNLTLNAIEASPDGGRVVWNVRPNGRSIELVIEDEGPGVNERDAGRIFEPFFTMREGGTGLGLAVSRRIATAGGGKLEWSGRATSGGARFTLTLPRAADWDVTAQTERKSIQRERGR